MSALAAHHLSQQLGREWAPDLYLACGAATELARDLAIGPQELVAHVQGNWVWVSFNCGKQSTGSQKGHREQGGAREGTGNDLASTGSAPTETKTHGRRAVV